MENYSSSGKRALNDDDVVGRNGRQKRRASSSNDQVTQLKETEYRILCPVNKVGSLIGKGGSIIKALRSECRSRIKVEDSVSGSDERVVTISSSTDQFGEQRYYCCAAQEALFKAHAKITEAEDENEPPQALTLRLLVPKIHVGCLIGKGGKIIEKMRKDIGAQIRILPKEQHPASAGSTDELVQVTGDAAQVRKALFEISTRLHENTSKEHPQRDAYKSQLPGHMVVPMFPGGGGIYPCGAYLQTGSFLAPISAGGSVHGLGHSYGELYGDIGTRNGWGLSTSPAATGAAFQADGATVKDFSLRVLCPISRIGSIIGKGGGVIKKLREESGAKIKVEDPHPDCDERVILISAAEFVDTYPSPVIEAVLQVLKRLAQLHAEKDEDNKSFSVRLLVPSSQIGCLLGKGGTIVAEMRKTTKANIRISLKHEPSSFVEEHDERVQIMGDQSMVRDALVQVANRLRGNFFKGQEGRDARSEFGSSMYQDAFYAGSNVFSSYKGGPDSFPTTAYSHMNMGGQNIDYGYSGISSWPSFGGEGEDSRRRQSY